MMCPSSPRLVAAVLRLAHYAAARHAGSDGETVRELWLDELCRYEPGALPDALYVEPADPGEKTLLYDVRRNRFLTVVWTAWRNAREEENWDFSRYFD